MHPALAASHLTRRQLLGGIARLAMIDYFALALTHALIIIALLRMIGRDALDDDDAAAADRERAASRAYRRRGAAGAGKDAERSGRVRRGRRRDA